MNAIQRKELNNQIQRILHVPGNYRGGILEFALVVDDSLSQEQIVKASAELMAALKSCDKIFQNARLNLLHWVSDEEITKEVSSMGLVQMGRPFLEEKEGRSDKTFDELLRQLKLFYARSKIVILLTEGAYVRKDEAAIASHLKPFLGRKMMIVSPQQLGL